MRKQRNQMVRIVVGLSIAVALQGCDKSTSPGDPTNAQLSMTAKYSAQVLAKVAGVQAVDSVRVTRARFVIRDIKYKSQKDSANFRSHPFVLELALSGSPQTISTATVPFGTYSRVEFDVHRVEQPEIASLPVSEQAAFADFVAGEKYSIIIDGTVYTAGAGPQAFTYRSKVDAKQKIDLVPELVVSPTDASNNVTMAISSANWFKNLAGAFVNPGDTNNEGVIDENLKACIKVFKDKNRDGSRD